MANPTFTPLPSQETFVQLEPIIQSGPTNPVVVGMAEETQLKLHPCSSIGCQYAATAKCHDCEAKVCVEHAGVVTRGKLTVTLCERCRDSSRAQTKICVILAIVVVAVVFIALFAFS